MGLGLEYLFGKINNKSRFLIVIDKGKLLQTNYSLLQVLGCYAGKTGLISHSTFIMRPAICKGIYDGNFISRLDTPLSNSSIINDEIHKVSTG